MTAEILGTTVGFSHHSSKGVDWVFVEHGSYDRAGGLYSDENGVYGDNQVRRAPELRNNSHQVVQHECGGAVMTARVQTSLATIQSLMAA